MIEKIKNQVQTGDYRFTIHGFERCVERDISPKEVKYAILSGEVIEKYPKDKFGPSCLIYGIGEEGELKAEIRGHKSEVRETIETGGRIWKQNGSTQQKI